MIEVELSRIVITETNDSQIIVLKEKGGTRNFPIVVGFFEATAIDRGVKEIPTPRPLTHDLLRQVIQELKGDLKRIVISDLRNNTFYAKLVVEQNGGVVEIDSRPSDAIAIAVQDDTPIFVEEAVIDEVCKWQSPAGPEVDFGDDLDSDDE